MGNGNMVNGLYAGKYSIVCEVRVDGVPLRLGLKTLNIKCRL